MAEPTTKKKLKPSNRKNSKRNRTSGLVKGERKTKDRKDLYREGPLWDEALDLEKQLEEKLLEDAIYSARVALKDLEEETRKMPFERRSGLRLKEKALKTERAFNRLRALRKGEQIPHQPDD